MIVMSGPLQGGGDGDGDGDGGSAVVRSWAEM